MKLWVLFFKVYLFLRERVCVHELGKSRERGRHGIWKQAPGSELSAQSPMQGLDPWAMRSWPELKLEAQPTEPPRHRHVERFLNTANNCRLKCSQWHEHTHVVLNENDQYEKWCFTAWALIFPRSPNGWRVWREEVKELIVMGPTHLAGVLASVCRKPHL